MGDTWVTTLDNPWDYFTNYEEWSAFDRSQGYNTEAYVARLVRTYEDEAYVDINQKIDQVIDEIVRFNLTGNYKKVYRNVEISTKDSNVE